jgi:hypothetical protein
MSWRESPERRCFEEATGRSLLEERRDFAELVRDALARGQGFATGKLGNSELPWLYYPILLDKNPPTPKRWTFERTLLMHFERQCGLFPAKPDFCLSFTQQYVEYVHRLNALGIILDQWPILAKVINHYQFRGKIFFHTRLEPDRSIPANDDACYLSLFRGKRILLICPFAEFLAERANRETFERVWAKTGKRWFEPASVDAIEFPYGFEPTTQERYETVLDLLDEIMPRVRQRDFDVALIAAAGLAIPIAAQIKDMGKIGISLGGHLQIVFGVLGKRWRTNKQWQRDYFNDAWVDVPARYHPTRTDVCDFGAYW